MANWIQKGTATTVREYIKQSTGMDPDVLANQKNTPYWMIGGMSDTCKIVLSAIKAGKHITIFGDYDADGIGASAILWLTLCHIGQSSKNITVRLPKRFSEGYGITPSAITEIADGLVICVDNGIAAYPAIKAAKDKGLTVCVMDHHLQDGETKVPADTTVDQHVEYARQNYRIPDNWKDNNLYISDPEDAFIDFCGAGLALKFAEGIIPQTDTTKEELLKKMTAIAAISTVADSVTLLGDNRNIVKKGIEAINKSISEESSNGTCEITKGLLSILHALKVYKIQDEDIAFKLAPLLNAPGRLIDAGSRIPCACLCQDNHEIPDIAATLLDLNNQRKILTAESVARAHEILGDKVETAPILIFDPDASKGIVGIVAGQLAEEYGLPTIVFALSEDKKTWSGSGRAGQDAVNLKEMLDKVANTLSGYGGHAGAAGVSLAVGNEQAFKDAIEKAMKDIHPLAASDTKMYDIEARIENVQELYAQMMQYAPYGQGNPAPVIRLRNVKVEGYAGKFGRLMGDHQQHIKFTAIQQTSYGQPKPTKIDILAFGLADKYIALGNPGVFDVIGTIGYKNDAYGKAIQFMVEDIQTN